MSEEEERAPRREPARRCVVLVHTSKGEDAGSSCEVLLRTLERSVLDREEIERDMERRCVEWLRSFVAGEGYEIVGEPRIVWQDIAL